MSRLQQFELVAAFALVSVLVLATPRNSSAQDDGDSGDEASVAVEVQEPAPTAEAEYPVEGRPPHPRMPEQLVEGTPDEATRASTPYIWVAGYWSWTGEAYEWIDGIWAYPLHDYHYVDGRWDWNGERWTFLPAGWAAEGSDDVDYGVLAVPEEGPTQETIYYVEPTTTTVYVYSGVYVAPLVVYPVWHYHYHAHWYVHYRPPVHYYHPYHSYAARRAVHYRSHYRHGYRYPHHGGARPARAPAGGHRPPGARPPGGSGNRPSTGRPSGGGSGNRSTAGQRSSGGSRRSTRPSSSTRRAGSSRGSYSRGRSMGSRGGGGRGGGRGGGGGRRR